MREILFQGKRPGNEEWVQGYHVCIGGKYHYICTGKLDICNVLPVFEHHLIDPGTLVQYTGLTDKNGVMIFEGDVVLVDEYKRYVVKFSLERMGYEPFATGDGCGCCEVDTVHHEYQSIEVIGNIHDNPELLKEES